MIEDINEQDDAVKVWTTSDPGAAMPNQALIDLVTNGFRTCNDYCSSRERYGEESCLCVRELFPSLEHYGMYLEMREWYLSRLAESMALAIIGEED